MLDAEERIFARKKAKGWGTEIVGESAGQRVSRLPEKLRNAGLFVSEAARFVHHIHDKQERNGMETEQKEIGERLEAATTLLERTLNWLEERQGALTGEVERISATVEQSRREAELGELRAAAATTVVNPLRRTVPAATSEMLAKHGIGEGPVNVRALDAALAGLSLEQRIAVKTQLLRAGAIA
jgi:hypothetical protein